MTRTDVCSNNSVAIFNQYLTTTGTKSFEFVASAAGVNSFQVNILLLLRPLFYLK